MYCAPDLYWQMEIASFEKIALHNLPTQIKKEIPLTALWLFIPMGIL